MKTSHVVLAAIAVVATVAAVAFGALYFTKDSSSTSAAAEECGDRSFGHISALGITSGDAYQMRFDPAWFTSGVTANTAAAEDGVVEPGEPVPNDNYRIEEGHRLLTYVVPDGHPRHRSDEARRPGQPRRHADHGLRARSARRRQEAGRALRAARHRSLDSREHRHRLLDRPAVPALASVTGLQPAGLPTRTSWSTQELPSGSAKSANDA